MYEFLFENKKIGQIILLIGDDVATVKSKYLIDENDWIFIKSTYIG